ncbi:MAG: efflux RND transporter periplasmic adaptor subunit [Pseudomonadota bacterium]|nr:efflux RND transporter periplasmic adaptor subunit [Pseudomonadota bacterium]
MIRDTAATDRVLQADASRHTRQRVLLVAGSLVALVLVGWSVNRFFATERSVDASRLRFAEVVRGALVRDAIADGRIVAADIPSVYSPANGSVALRTRAGASVKKGDVLAEIDSPELQAELERERAALASLDATTARSRIESERLRLTAVKSVDEGEVARTAAVRDLERAERGFKSGAIAEVDYLRAQDALEAAQIRSKHAAADSALNNDAVGFEQRTRDQELRRQRSVVAELERRRDELTVRAPVDGIVGTVAVSDRTKLARDALLMVVVDLSRLEVEIRVPESYADDLGIGMAVDLSLPSGKITGRLSTISPEVIGSEVLARVAFVDDQPAGLRQNQRVSVRVLIENKPDVLLLRRGPFVEQSGGRHVFVVRDGIAERRAVRLGDSSLEAVEVLEGLAPGDNVVIAGTDLFQESSRVRIND